MHHMQLAGRSKAVQVVSAARLVVLALNYPAITDRTITAAVSSYITLGTGGRHSLSCGHR
eukprot:scaffold191693_cov30-Prasinocladus_malaysianus.AAC.2